jgi:hypothetical protein
LPDAGERFKGGVIAFVHSVRNSPNDFMHFQDFVQLLGDCDRMERELLNLRFRVRH